MRIAIITDVSAATPRLLTEATLAAIERRSDATACGFVTSAPDELLPPPMRRARRLAVDSIGRLAGTSAMSGRFHLARIARRHDLPVLTTDDPSDERFVERLHRELRPTVLLSYFCLRVLRPSLLDSVEQAVNYHDGALPARAGLGATYHSVYEGDETSGFVFHRMEPEIDAGPILLEGAVPVGPLDSGDEVHRRKAAAASALVPGLLDLLADRSPGTPQSGERRYRSAQHAAVITDIADPSALTGAEIQRRIRAFGGVALEIGGREEYVTAVAAAGSRSDPLAFETADGRLRALAIAGLPARLVRARRRIDRRRR